MSRCPDALELAALVDGEVAESRGETLRTHAKGCSACARALTHLGTVTEELRAPTARTLASESADAFADDVLARLDEPRAAPPARRRWLGAASLAATAAAAAVFAIGIARHRSADEGEWTARGGGSSDGVQAVQHVLLRFGRVASAGFEPLDDGARLDTREVLAADVGHTGRQPLYLLSFLVDAAGERHWIYPAYEVGAAPPTAEPLPVTVDARVLSTMTRVEDLAIGPARLVGVVLTAPESVAYVEAAPASDLTRERLASHYPGALVIETKVVVAEGNPQ